MKLKKIVEKVIDNRGKTPPLVDNGYELLEVNAVNESSRTPDYQKVRKFVSKDTYENWFRTGNITYNDILIPTVGTIGGCCISKQERGSIAQNLIALRINKQIADPDYIFYYFRTSFFKKELLNLDIGGVQPSIKVPHLLNLEISLPPLSEQKRISSILSSFDNKIEQLKKENNILEDIAQSIFKEWFVKYNFPNKDGKPYRDNNGKMIDSELGLIPEGWRVGKLGEVITLQTGFVHNTSITGPAKSLIAKMGVVDGISRFNRNSVIPYSKSIDSKYKLEENDLIVCTRDVTRDNLVIGNVSQTPPDLAVRGLYAGSNTWIIKSNLNKNYLFLYLRERKFREHIIKSSKGSTIVMITQDAFLKCPYIFPQEEIINLFNETNEDLFKKAKVNDQEIQNLENIKSHLLNKLLT